MKNSILNQNFLDSIENNNLEKAKYYLSQGANINAINDKGLNAIYISIKNGNQSAIKFLLDHRISLGDSRQEIESNIIEILLQQKNNQLLTLGCHEGELKKYFLEEGLNYEEVSSKLYKDAIYKLSKLDKLNEINSIPFLTHQIYFTSTTNPKEIDPLSKKITIARINSQNDVYSGWLHNVWTNNLQYIPQEIKTLANVKVRLIDEFSDSFLWTELNIELQEQNISKASLTRSSDIARAIVIKKYGGHYFDLDYQMYNATLHFKVSKAFDFIGGIEKAPFQDVKMAPLFASAYFAAKKGHIIIDEIIKFIKRNYNSNAVELLDYVNFPCSGASLNIYKASGYPLTLSAFLNSNKNGNIDLVAPNEIFFHYRYAHYITTESKCYSPNNPARLSNYFGGIPLDTVGADTQCGSWAQTPDGKLNIIYYPKNINLYLFEASKHGYTRIIQYLINQGADVNEYSSSGASPVYMSAQNGHLGTVIELTKHNADIDTLSKNGLNAVSGALLNKHYNIADYLLSIKKTSIHTLLIEQLTLHEVLQFGDYPHLVKYILENKKDLNEVNEFGASALCIAIDSKLEASTNQLLIFGANPNFALENGNTPMHIAAERNSSAIVELLSKFNANPYARNIYNETALDIAIFYNHHQICEFLQELTQEYNKNICGNNTIHIGKVDDVGDTHI